MLNALFQAAFSAHVAGQLAEAKSGYLQVLSNDAHHADALHMLGVAHLESGKLTEAETLIRKALAVEENAFYLGNLANVLKDSRRVPEAEAVYRRAIALKPDFMEAHYNLAGLLLASQRLPEAEAAYQRAIALKPDYPEAHYYLARVLRDCQRLHEAELACQRALALMPEYFEAHNLLANLLEEAQRLSEAEKAYRHALVLKPDDAETYYNLAVLLNESQRLPEAEAAYRYVLTLNPDYTNAHYNLANILQISQRLPEAEAAYRRATALRPDFFEAHYNLAILLTKSKRLLEAEALYRCALAIKPGPSDATLNLSHLLLALQRYAEAWPLYESRYAPSLKNRISTAPNLPFPQWQGQSLKGKSLVIWPEQGFGDYIQFVRYAPLLKVLGVSHLTIVCSPHLSALLSTVHGIDAVVTGFTQVPAHDYWSFVMSLPLHCAMTAETIPVMPKPYVHALPARVALWRDRLPAFAGRKVGLVWKGSLEHGNDAHRSLPGLASLAPLWAVAGVVFVSLQRGQGEQEALQVPPGQPLVELGTQIQDFADSAAIVSQLDLVICVDTAIAHVAGALGKPCWLLLPAIDTDWRWQLDRTDSPWYPSIRLFRQSDLTDWSQTVREVATALKTWVRVPC